MIDTHGDFRRHRQSEHRAKSPASFRRRRNVSLSWRHRSFSARVLYNFTGSHITTYSSTSPALNLYRFDRNTVNVGVAYQLRPSLSLTLRCRQSLQRAAEALLRDSRPHAGYHHQLRHGDRRRQRPILTRSGGTAGPASLFHGWKPPLHGGAVSQPPALLIKNDPNRGILVFISVSLDFGVLSSSSPQTSRFEHEQCCEFLIPNCWLPFMKKSDSNSPSTLTRRSLLQQAGLGLIGASALVAPPTLLAAAAKSGAAKKPRRPPSRWTSWCRSIAFRG